MALQSWLGLLPFRSRGLALDRANRAACLASAAHRLRAISVLSSVQHNQSPVWGDACLIKPPFFNIVLKNTLHTSRKKHAEAVAPQPPSRISSAFASHLLSAPRNTNPLEPAFAERPPAAAGVRHSPTLVRDGATWDQGKIEKGERVTAEVARWEMTDGDWRFCYRCAIKGGGKALEIEITATKKESGKITGYTATSLLTK